MDWWTKNTKYVLNLSMIMTLPNSSIYKYAIANGLIPDEFEYMKNNFPIINLTKLSNQRFKKLNHFVNTFDQNNEYGINGEVISSKNELKKNSIENVYTIRVKCPECHAISEYKNMTQISLKKYSIILCRNCRMRLRVNTKKCFYDNYTLRHKIIYSNIKTEQFLRRKFPVLKKIFYKIPIFKQVYYKIRGISKVRFAS